MASFEVVSHEVPYLTLIVKFDEKQFEQTLITSKKGTELDTFLQEYADSYEAAYVAPVEPII